MKKEFLLRLNIQHFAADPTPNPTPDPTPDPTPTPDPAPALTADDVQKLIQSEVDKVRTEYSKKNSTLQKQLDEEKKSKMTEQEKLDLAKQELDQQKRELQQEKNKLFAIQSLSGAEMPASFLDFVVADTDENTTAKIQALKTEFDKAVAAEVDKQFKSTGRTFKKSSDGSSVTKEQFAQMGYAERAKLAADDPELYQQLKTS